MLKRSYNLCFLFLLGVTALLSAGEKLFAQISDHSAQLLPVGIWDRKGQFVSGIGPEQIVITGFPATIKRFELDSSPRRILLLLDTSGSMGERKSFSWSSVERIAIHLALQRKGDGLIALDTFGEEDESRVPMTTDAYLVVRQIQSIASSGIGRTMVGLALREILGRRENGLRFGDTIILISDGERSDGDKTDFQRLREDLIRIGVRICLIRVTPVMGFGATQDATGMSKFIKETGGTVLDSSSPLQQFEPRKGGLVDPGYS